MTAPPGPAGPVEHSLVVQTAFLGDLVLTTPLIARLARRGPVDVVATPVGAPLLANNPDVRHLLVYDKRGADRGPAGLARFARRVRSLRGDGRAPTTAYLAQGSLRSATLALLAGAGERVGFATSGGRALYTRRAPYRRDQHHAERLLRLADAGTALPETLPPGILRPRLYPGPAERAAVDALLGGAPADAGPLVALAPGSVWATKRWPYYEELAAELRRRLPGSRVVLVGGPQDAPFADALAAAAGAGRVVDATGRLSLLGSAELIGRAAVLVTNDSAPQHLASAMGTPTVTLFGPTVAAFGFGPLAPGSESLGHETLACRPCDAHGPRRCPLGHWRCMRELGEAGVADRVLAVIGAGGEAAARG
jgi:heptosyltransferase-2